MTVSVKASLVGLLLPKQALSYAGRRLLEQNAVPSRAFNVYPAELGTPMGPPKSGMPELGNANPQL